jgi:ATP/maltotriose-dependent transcriptional regulator MalT
MDAANAGIEVYLTGPPEKRDYGNETSLRIQLANAQVFAGQLDAASATLESVFTLPLNQRVAWLGSDMKKLRRALADIDDQRSTEFQLLQSGAEEFVSSLLSRSATGGTLT